MFEGEKNGEQKFQLFQSLSHSLYGTISSKKGCDANEISTSLQSFDTFSKDSSQPLIQDDEREDYHNPHQRKKQPISFCKAIIHLFKKHWFLLALGVIVLLSALVPQIGNIRWLKDAQHDMIATLLFLIGFKLALGKIAKGILSWKIHLLVQFFLLVFQPFFVWSLMKLLPNIFSKVIFQAIIIIHTLPTSTSTCVVFTAASNGNEAAALFNATLSNIAGIFTAPALVYLLIFNSSAYDVDIEETKILRSLGLILIMPLCIGQLTRLLLLKILDKIFLAKIQLNNFEKGIGLVNKLVLLLITLVVFAETFAGGAHGFTLNKVIGLCAFLTGLHLLWWILAFITTHFHRGIWFFDHRDRVAIMYCASQRSMSIGIPIVMTIFSDSSKSVIGSYTLILVIYHTLLTLVAGVFVDLLSSWVERDPHYKVSEIKHNENT